MGRFTLGILRKPFALHREQPWHMDHIRSRIYRSAQDLFFSQQMVSQISQTIRRFSQIRKTFSRAEGDSFQGCCWMPVFGVMMMVSSFLLQIHFLLLHRIFHTTKYSKIDANWTTKKIKTTCSLETIFAPISCGFYLVPWKWLVCFCSSRLNCCIFNSQTPECWQFFSFNTGKKKKSIIVAMKNRPLHSSSFMIS